MCGPRLPHLSTTCSVIASAAITILIVFRITPKVFKIAISTWPCQIVVVVASPVPRSSLLLLQHNLVNQLLKLFKFEILLPHNLFILVLLLPKLIAILVHALNLRIQLIF